MDNIDKTNKKFLIIFLTAIVLLTIASFWRALDFYFWRDDWDLWSQQHYFWEILKLHNHPGTWISRALLFHVLGWNSVAWQGLGLALKIASSLAISLLLLQISKSKTVAVLTGIFFATTIIGMETVTWASVYIIPIVIVLVSLGFYMWILFVEKRALKYALISILLILLGIIGDAGRAIFIAPMIALWEFFNWWISSKRENLFRLLFRVGFLIILCIVSIKIAFSYLYGTYAYLEGGIKYVYDPKYLATIFTSIRNLLFGWLKPSGADAYSQLTLPIIITLLLVGLYLGFFKKSRFGMTLLLLTLWMPVAYLPNWIYDKSVPALPTDRYLAISSIGYVGLLALLLSKIKIRLLMYLLLFLYIFINVKTANEVIIRESSFRSSKIIKPYFDQIEREVPKGEKNSIFVYTGNDNVKYVDLDWSGSNPFGITRGMTKYEDFPIVTADEKLILKLLCEDNVYRPSNLFWTYQKTRIPLSHLHAWELNGGILKNISTIKREEFKKKARLNNCSVID